MKTRNLLTPNHNYRHYLLPVLWSFFCFMVTTPGKGQKAGKTEITTWSQGKNGAVSITFDDGSINQFEVALPILNNLSLPATFFIITGQIPGSRYQGKFVGRPVSEIISETAAMPTQSENFFERASAIGFAGYAGTLPYHTEAGALFDESDGSKAAQAHAVIDEGYRKIRQGDFERKSESTDRGGVTWNQIRTYASQGHEFASHTVTHPRLAVLDEANLRYELDKSKAEIQEQLGTNHTFSAEGPYGTENERVMQYMYPIYPALRNRMPEPFLEELNRWNTLNPGMSDKPYVQWQRGATTQTPLPQMKSWVDTAASNNNNWLVLVFHGVDGVGYEALPGDLLKTYFEYIKAKESDLWVATFGDVTKYMRERMAASWETHEEKKKLVVTLRHSLDQALYNIPLTLRSYVPAKWTAVHVRQGNVAVQSSVHTDAAGTYVQYHAIPNAEAIIITPIP